MRAYHAARGNDERTRLQITPMIDVVFLLLVFFILTFKIVATEGDFNISMPTAYAVEAPSEPTLLPMRVRLISDSEGQLTEVHLNGRRLRGEDPMKTLHLEIIGVLSEVQSIQEPAEVEFDCDYGLRYDHVIDAITAVSGYRVDNGNIVRLVKNVRFAPIRNPR